MSCNVAVGVLLWFALPSFCFVIGLLQSEVIPSQDQGNTTTLALNITKPKFNSMYFALSLASYTTLSLERFAVLCSPVTLSVMFNGWKRISPKDGCLQLSRVFLVLLLAAGSHLAACSLSITLYCSTLAKQQGVWNAVVFGLAVGTHAANYLLMRVSNLFLSGCLMKKLTIKCLKADEQDAIVEARSCLEDYNRLRLNLGPMLLVFMSIDSLLVMLNSFMVYLFLTRTFTPHLFVYVLFDLNALLSLMYICVLCDECSSAMRALLIPLRCFIICG